MAAPDKPSLMRNLGAFFGHIVKAVRTDPGGGSKKVRRRVEERREGDVILRRTTIEEIEKKA